MIPVYIASYPKSGSTYLTRLLGDILNCPTGGCVPEEDATDPAAEGQDRPAAYIVRRGHFVLVDNETGPVIPEPHKLAYKRITDERIIFLVRDPRDICISGAYHWQMPVEAFLEQMIAGEVAGCGRWDDYCQAWLGFAYSQYAKGNRVILDQSYETIHWQSMVLVGNFLKLDYDISRISKALDRQSFEARAAGLDEEEMRRNNMRKGIVGDWRNHFTPEMNDRIWREFGGLMERFGYER